MCVDTTCSDTQEKWDSFMRMLDPVASNVPWMVAAGNHEIEAGSTASGPFAAFQHRFRMPSVAPAVRGFECGVAGGLDGNRTACGPGLNDLSSKGASAKESEAADFDGGWMTQAVLGAREAVSPFERPVSSTGWPESEGGGAEEDEGEVDGLVPKCSPSEWSGTYDFGNRWVKSCINCLFSTIAPGSVARHVLLHETLFPSRFYNTIEEGQTTKRCNCCVLDCAPSTVLAPSRSFYSFDVASVHVVVLNPYTATGEGSVQHSWLLEVRVRASPSTRSDEPYTPGYLEPSMYLKNTQNSKQRTDALWWYKRLSVESLSHFPE